MIFIFVDTNENRCIYLGGRAWKIGQVISAVFSSQF